MFEILNEPMVLRKALFDKKSDEKLVAGGKAVTKAESGFKFPVTFISVVAFVVAVTFFIFKLVNVVGLSAV